MSEYCCFGEAASVRDLREMKSKKVHPDYKVTWLLILFINPMDQGETVRVALEAQREGAYLLNLRTVSLLHITATSLQIMNNKV